MVIDGLETISKLTATTVDDKAVAVLHAIAQAVEAGPGVAEMPATTAEPLARLHAVDALAQESPAGDLP
jgi:hypothetical protein